MLANEHRRQRDGRRYILRLPRVHRLESAHRGRPVLALHREMGERTLCGGEAWRERDGAAQGLDAARDFSSARTPQSQLQVRKGMRRIEFDGTAQFGVNLVAVMAPGDCSGPARILGAWACFNAMAS